MPTDPTQPSAADQIAAEATPQNVQGALAAISPGVLAQAKSLPGGETIHLPNTPPAAVSVSEINGHALAYDGVIQHPSPNGIGGPPPPITTLPSSPQPLDQAYQANAEARNSAALDQEVAALKSQAAAAAASPQPGVPQASSPILQAAGDVAGDVAKGIGIEGMRSAILGAKSAVNETVAGAEQQQQDVHNFLTSHLGDLGGSAAEMGANVLDPVNGLATIASKFGVHPRLPVSPGEEPTTVTGGIIKNTAQFLTGMVGAGKVTEGWKAAAVGGKVLKGLANGALADFSAFDGHQARLSNMLAPYAPEQVRSILDFLAADKNDPELVARTKAAVEGLGLGALSEGVFKGIANLRAMRVARQAAAESHAAEGGQVPIDLNKEAAEAAGQKVAADVNEALKPESKSLPIDQAYDEAVGAVDKTIKAGVAAFVGKVRKALKTTSKTDEKIASQIAGAEVEPNSFDIDFNNIKTPDDIKAVISTLADRFAGKVDEARRGLRTHEDTSAAADTINWIDSMGRRSVGQAMNAEHILAYRQALNASAGKLLELSREVLANPTLPNQFAFRQMLGMHHAIQSEFMGARAEAGRALNAFRIPAGTPARYLRQVESMMADLGGPTSAQELARLVQDAADKGDIVFNQLVRGAWNKRASAIIRLVYTNSLLSGVGTGIINVLGNTTAAMLNLTARAVSPRLAAAFGGVPETQVGEALALMHGYVGGARDAFRMTPGQTLNSISANNFSNMRQLGLFRGLTPGIKEAMPAGMDLRNEREEAGANVGETFDQHPLSAAAWRVSEDTTLGRALDVLQMVVSSPSNFHAMSDDFFKMMSARASLHAQAFRQASRELQAGLLDSQDAVKVRLQDLVDNPSDEMLDAADKEMHDLTFTRKTPGVADAFGALRRALDNNPFGVPVGSIILPFLRTPANLISTGMAYSPLAPFMRRFRDALAEGGADAEIAKAKMAIGSVMWSYLIGLAADGHITGAGPSNRGQKEALMRRDDQGGVIWQPYSIRVGDRWYSYERTDPLGTSMSLAADSGELLSNKDWDDAGRQTFDQVSAHAVTAIGHAFFDKTALKGVLDFTDAISSGDQSKTERWFQERASASIPGSSAMRMVRRGTDPYLREVSSTMDAMRNTVPLLSQGLPLQRDLWGKPRTYQTGLGTVYDSIVPIQTAAAGGAAIDLEILHNGVVVSMPPRTVSVDGESVSLQSRPDIYSEFVRQAGEPAFAKLNAVATGRDLDSSFYFGLSDGPEGGKSKYITEVISAYRQAARASILDKYAADLQSMAATSKRRRDEARGGDAEQLF